MIPFSKKFPELGPRETRTAVFADGGVGFPAGRYAFVESYCEERDCDCRRVMLSVIEESTPGKIWATISFSWEWAESAAWAKVHDLRTTASGAFLDPICQQSEHATEFLEFFEATIARDPAYVERLKRHYDMFKAAPPPRTRSSQMPHSETRAKRPKLASKKKLSR